MLTADALTLLDPSTPDMWPQGILAAADLREQRAKTIPEPRWFALGSWIATDIDGCNCGGEPGSGAHEPFCGTEPVIHLDDKVTAEHIAAEANPAHALAEVRLWREVAAWASANGKTEGAIFSRVVSAARAYLGGAA